MTMQEATHGGSWWVIPLKSYGSRSPTSTLPCLCSQLQLASCQLCVGGSAAECPELAGCGQWTLGSTDSSWRLLLVFRPPNSRRLPAMPNAMEAGRHLELEDRCWSRGCVFGGCLTLLCA
ncbi:hypothetical protein SRHO_G00312990 [Serrasalmus rhombeus]